MKERIEKKRPRVVFYSCVMHFEWDVEKDVKNQKKHAIAFDEACLAFEDSHRIVIEDTEHSKREKRYFCIGKIPKGIVTVRFTYRGSTIRIFGVGLWRKGKKLYEEKNHLYR